ncbi:MULTISPECIES: restriction endonuclease subunit S [Enterobacteriaceae]|uniref:restriction endonuclease subunit S n=1 Tax=Enterobacteriaceae TaxID=543 RepID=UPI000E2BFCB6|nr:MULTISPECIES: restriction endonuclease subunit S [Enterobacteriaceae]HBS4243043.1 restriction endonuclease subunit S [Klebsiella quasipneumoniae subsp. quasipneumoniae]MCJ6009966.1 restriction endonuclease subunit S [Klebsiella pneumoniae]MCQ0834919.1 restriction endonuclease subunit S [Klebsiella pneumoniae]MDN6928429.1 restriction endonuclease subunit S [Klebsiella pneumoniae]QJO48679.1 restriction endonuclease subunit S [Klebsiella pneumoniae]
MSELSYLEKLLDGVEVEWRNLGDTSLFEIANNGRKPVKASLRIAGETPYYGANNIQDYVDGYTHDGEYVLIAEDGSASLENYSIQYATGKFWANNHVHVVRGKERVHSRFLYHYLCIVNFLPFLTGGGRAKLTKGQLIEIPVPIPCPNNPEKSLAIQSEIVRILDKFTALTAELTAELTMRKKQYNYYRDQLLSFDEGEVEWKTLGAIGKFTYGYAAKAQISGDARFVRITDINTNGKLSPFEPMFVDISAENEKYTLKKNDLLMARTGATFGKTMIFEEDYPAIYAGFLIKLSLDRDIIDPKYYWHFAQSDYFWEQANKLVSGGGQPQFNANALKQIKVPIPYPNEAGKSLSEQARIVSVLDKFDILASSITEGLPREIELRQKQYEYYRDLLFSFPKPEIASH